MSRRAYRPSRRGATPSKKRKKHTQQAYLYLLIPALIFIASFFLVGLAEASSLLNHIVSIIIYCLTLVLALLVLGSQRNYTGSSAFSAYRESLLEASIYLASAAGAFVVLTAGFSGLCRQLYLQLGGFAAFPSQHPISGGYWHWLWFGFSWILDNGLFNASQIFQWPGSDIQASEFWSRVLVFAFNVAMKIFAVVTVIRGFRWLRQTQLDEVLWPPYSSSYLRDVGLTLSGVAGAGVSIVLAYEGVRGAVQEDLPMDSVIHTLLYCAPLLVGAPLVVHSLLALLRMAGTRNKMQASGGLIVGAVLVYVGLPLLFSGFTV